MDNPSNFSLTTDINPTNTDSDTRVLSAPRIVVSHNEEGVINVSSSRPIITGSTTSGVSSTLNTRSSVEYRDIGIKLKVTPLIGADGTVQMVIEQTVENVTGNITIDNNTQPIIGVREATSTISVKNREIIVLGGLQENSNSDSNNYFPIFGRLPILSSIFGKSTDDYERKEIIIFIRPTVLHRPEEAEVLAEAYIENASEEEVIKTYLKEDTTGDIYLEGSKFEDPDKPKRERIWPRSLRR